jgi:hypothetical protein
MLCDCIGWKPQIKVSYSIAISEDLSKRKQKKSAMQQTNEPVCIIRTNCFLAASIIQTASSKNPQSAEKDIHIQWEAGGWASIVHTLEIQSFHHIRYAQ